LSLAKRSPFNDRIELMTLANMRENGVGSLSSAAVLAIQTGPSPLVCRSPATCRLTRGYSDGIAASHDSLPAEAEMAPSMADRVGLLTFSAGP
jgi:hypothetical protein